MHQNFVTKVITFAPTIINFSKRKRKKDFNSIDSFNSIGQDVIYSLLRGRKRTKKHVALALCLKRKTGSKDILTWLNRLGHCISYDEVNRI